MAALGYIPCFSTSYAVVSKKTCVASLPLLSEQADTDTLTLASDAVASPASMGVSALPRADVLIVLAHPDDEIFLSGAAALLSRSGLQVQLVYVTSGCQGRDRSGLGLKRGKELALARELEARNALNTLGVNRQPLFLRFIDGRIPAQADMIREKLNVLLEQVQPRLVLTFGPDGITGHPDHQWVGRLMDETVAQQQGKVEGGVELYHVTLSEKGFQVFREAFRGKCHAGWTGMISTSNAQVSVRYPIGDPDILLRKMLAIAAHRTQFTKADLQGLNRFNQTYPYEEFIRYSIRFGWQFSDHSFPPRQESTQILSRKDDSSSGRDCLHAS